MSNYDLKVQLMIDVYGQDYADKWVMRTGWKSFPFHTQKEWERRGFKLKPKATPFRLKEWVRIDGHFKSKYIEYYFDFQVEPK